MVLELETKGLKPETENNFKINNYNYVMLTLKYYNIFYIYFIFIYIFFIYICFYLTLLDIVNIQV